MAALPVHVYIDPHLEEAPCLLARPGADGVETGYRFLLSFAQGGSPLAYAVVRFTADAEVQVAVAGRSLRLGPAGAEARADAAGQVELWVPQSAGEQRFTISAPGLRQPIDLRPQAVLEGVAFDPDRLTGGDAPLVAAGALSAAARAQVQALAARGSRLDRRDGYILQLRTANGHYVCAEDGGGGAVNASRSSASTWERFTIVPVDGGALRSGARVALIASNGQYLCADAGGGGAILANRPWRRAWETFVIEAVGETPLSHGAAISLRCASGAYLCAEEGGGGLLLANRAAVGPWETFTAELSLPPPSTNGASTGRRRPVREFFSKLRAEVKDLSSGEIDDLGDVVRLVFKVGEDVVEQVLETLEDGLHALMGLLSTAVLKLENAFARVGATLAPPRAVRPLFEVIAHLLAEGGDFLRQGLGWLGDRAQGFLSTLQDRLSAAPGLPAALAGLSLRRLLRLGEARPTPVPGWMDGAGAGATLLHRLPHTLLKRLCTEIAARLDSPKSELKAAMAQVEALLRAQEALAPRLGALVRSVGGLFAAPAALLDLSLGQVEAALREAVSIAVAGGAAVIDLLAGLAPLAIEWVVEAVNKPLSVPLLEAWLQVALGKDREGQAPALTVVNLVSYLAAALLQTMELVAGRKALLSEEEARDLCRMRWQDLPVFTPPEPPADEAVSFGPPAPSALPLWSSLQPALQRGVVIYSYVAGAVGAVVTLVSSLLAGLASAADEWELQGISGVLGYVNVALGVVSLALGAPIVFLYDSWAVFGLELGLWVYGVLAQVLNLLISISSSISAVGSNWIAPIPQALFGCAHFWVVLALFIADEVEVGMSEAAVLEKWGSGLDRVLKLEQNLATVVPELTPSLKYIFLFTGVPINVARPIVDMEAMTFSNAIMLTRLGTSIGQAVALRVR